MLSAWLRKWTAKTTEDRKPRPAGHQDEPPTAPTDEPAALHDSDPELPPYDHDEWTQPIADPWSASPADDAPTVPDAAAEAAEFNHPDAEPLPYFAFDDGGAPGTDAWRSEGWWLRAEPKPQRRLLGAQAKRVPAVMKAWTVSGTAAASSPDEAPMLRGDERIALLREIGRRFAFDQVADLLTPPLANAA
jgi:hypothetical protein